MNNSEALQRLCDLKQELEIARFQDQRRARDAAMAEQAEEEAAAKLKEQYGLEDPEQAAAAIADLEAELEGLHE